MYKCLKCGNEKEFVEYNLVQTRITIEDGEVESSYDRFVGCEFFICDKCKASSEDGDVIICLQKNGDS